MKNRIETEGLIRLLEIKDSDIRMTTLKQGLSSIDKGIHAGGASSAIIPLVTLYYGGTMRFDVDNPMHRHKDMFVLSKGHAVASLATIYADLGYFDVSLLEHSRSQESLLNGHPGPILPGIPVSTGPLGQGCCVAQGYAYALSLEGHGDVYSMLGDGELQEGLVWESVMLAAQKRLDNLCYIVDKNHGQLDKSDRMILPMEHIDAQFSGFGWNVISVDGTKYGPVLEALRQFKYEPRNGRPTVIICNTEKGFGSCSHFLTNHKVTLNQDLAEQELGLQEERRKRREIEFFLYAAENASSREGLKDQLQQSALRMNLSIDFNASRVTAVAPQKKLKQLEPLNKHIAYRSEHLPKLDPAKQYAASDIVTSCMKEFARDERVASADADLSSTSGLFDGVSHADQRRALNVGIAEANMMNIGEAFASLGYNMWVSTFCPFFDVKVLRRIAIGQQERLESIEANSWLTEGHIMDLTFLATAPNFETKTNGATHMGNDDIMIINQIGSMRIIDVSCPNLLIGILKWVMKGNQGLLYIRILRSPSSVLYPNPVDFEYGKSYVAHDSKTPQAVILSSGRGVYEAKESAALLKDDYGIEVKVVDVPSVDMQLFKELINADIPVLFAEQNNGYLWSEFRSFAFAEGITDPKRFSAVNTTDTNQRPQYIHSATYEELIAQFGLSPKQLVKRVLEMVQ